MTTCPKCLKPIGDVSQKILTTPCGHLYHSQCLTEKTAGFLFIRGGVKLTLSSCLVCSSPFYSPSHFVDTFADPLPDLSVKLQSVKAGCGHEMCQEAHDHSCALVLGHNELLECYWKQEVLIKELLKKKEELDSQIVLNSRKLVAKRAGVVWDADSPAPTRTGKKRKHP